MPVTINPAPHSASEFRCFNNPVANAVELLSQSCPKENKKIKNDHIIQSSFKDITTETNVYPANNGFVDTAIKAYNEHQHLKIRPEDVWFSILAQLNIYMNEHAEELRDMFVAHKGQKHLEIKSENFGDIKGNALWGLDWGKFSFKMTRLIEENIKDPSLREWILPSFTTTTKIDQTVAAILMMATLQKYFTFGCVTCCGLPSATLLGQQSDWEKLASKAAGLVTFGEEPKLWYGLLKPVLARFVSSFDSPDAAETKDFWQKIAHYNGGSGPTYLSGWITAFCFWGCKGQTFYQAGTNPSSDVNFWNGTPCLQLDGARYHRIEDTDIPNGWALKARSSGNALDGRPGETGLDTLSVESGWWMYERLSDEEIKDAKEARAKAYKEKYGFEYLDVYD